MRGSGYILLFHARGIPVRASWFLPLGMVFFAGFAWRPGLFAAYPIVVLVHELGHALLARGRRLQVHGIDIDALGGQCRFGGDVSALDLQIVAWGGVLAQAVLAIATMVVLAFAPPSTSFTSELARGLIENNLFMAAFNLFPIAPLDGREAWLLPRTLYRRFKSRRARRKKKKRPEGPVRIDRDAVVVSIADALERAREEAREARKKQRDRT